jgi:hypothetical protein
MNGGIKVCQIEPSISLYGGNQISFCSKFSKIMFFDQFSVRSKPHSRLAANNSNTVAILRDCLFYFLLYQLLGNEKLRHNQLQEIEDILGREEGQGKAKDGEETKS